MDYLLYLRTAGTTRTVNELLHLKVGRSAFRQAFPKLWSRLRRLKYLRLALSATDEVFARIYASNDWESVESRSGPGSTLGKTRQLRSELPQLIEKLGVRSLLDAPCGDFGWMSQTPLALSDYIGLDIVGEIIESNQRLYAAPGRSFRRANLLADPLPRMDMILCRDCLVHFSDRDVRTALQNIKASGSRYLLTTTYPHESASRNIVTGQWQPLNLEAEPFFLPAPLMLIDERPLEARTTQLDKCLGLWDLQSLGERVGNLQRIHR